MPERGSEGFAGDFDSEQEQEELKSQNETLDLAKAAGTAAAVLGTTEKAEGQDVKKQRLEYDPYFTEMNKFYKIGFPDSPKSMTPEDKKFVTDLIVIQNKIVDLMPLKTKLRQTEPTERVDLNLDQIEKMRQELWELLKKRFNLPANYTAQDLNYTLVYELPNWLATHGILAKNASGRLRSIQTGSITIHVFYSLHQISKLGSDKVTVWGQDVDRDVLEAKPLDLGLEQRAYELLDPKQEAYTEYQNIVLAPLSQDLAHIKDGLRANYEEIKRKFQDVPQEKYLAAIANSPNPRHYAIGLALYKLIARFSPEHFLADDQERHIAHETGHIAFN